MELNKLYILTTFLNNEIFLYVIFYSFIFIFINYFSYLELKNKKINAKARIIFYGFYLIIGIYGKLGSDYYSYKEILEKNYSKEIFYNFIRYISFGSINIYYFLVVSLNILFLEIFKKKLNIKYTFFYLSIFVNFFLLDSVNIIRSFQAQLVVLLGFIYIIINKKLKGFFLVLNSIFFHKTAILNIVLFKYSFFKKLSMKKLFLIFLIGIILSKFIYFYLYYFLAGTKYIVYLRKKIFGVNWFLLNGISSSIKIYYYYNLLSLYQKNKKFYKKYKGLIKYAISGFTLLILIFYLSFSISPYTFLRLLFMISVVHLILLPKYQEYEHFKNKEYLKYVFVIFILHVINNIYILKMFASRIVRNLI